MKNVVVVGACGHVGLPFCLTLAEADYNVIGLDINQDVVDIVNKGVVPFIEEGAEELLHKLLRKSGDERRLSFTTDVTCLKDADVIAIMIGTPVDSEGNARTDDILSFVENTLAKNINPFVDPLIILRSTVSPGTTKLVSDTIKKLTNGLYSVAFCPERVAQGKSLVEAKQFPQLIGVLGENDYGLETFERAKKFFDKFLKNKCIKLTAEEAELGKLMTNMYRYVNFALANEFYMIASEYGADMNKIAESINLDYPRMNLPKPGPNVGGPCLFKDGKFLLDNVPYVDIIQSAFIINEGMPGYIWNIIKNKKEEVKRVLILGTTFKAESDDERNSLSFKFAKILKKNGVEYDFYDPYSNHEKNIFYNTNPLPMNEYDAVVVMTPHYTFKDFLNFNAGLLLPKPKNDLLIVDIWKKIYQSMNFPTGVYFYGEI